MAEVIVNAKAIDQLAADFEKAKRVLIARLGERGYQLLRDEVPYQTGNLKQGVSYDVDEEKLEATLVVSARSGATGATQAEKFNAKGESIGSVSLRAQPAYNYAEVVARGNKDATLRPKTAKAFLIPVPTAPTDEGYLIAGGQIFVVRRTRKGQKANPYDERAAKRLESEAPTIGQKVLEKFL